MAVNVIPPAFDRNPVSVCKFNNKAEAAAGTS